VSATTDQSAEDPIVEELETAIFAFLLVKQRYPILMATAAEMDRLRGRSDIRKTANGAAIQIMRDSFDMLVIDLYSVRERLARNGLFEMLKRTPERLSPIPSTAPDPYLAHLVTGQIRDAAIRLNGTDQPSTSATVENLCARFRDDTKALDDDRNRVRAHRYQQRRDTSDLFIVLPDLQGQIDVMRRYLEDLYLVITHNGHSMDLADTSGNLAEDMADIIVHGSINAACNYYGLARKTEQNPAPWYWHERQETLKAATGHQDVW
jgi:hypothetical protein